MDIMTKGEGYLDFTPDIIKLHFDFRIRAKEYNMAVENGVKTVESFVKLLQSLGFKKEDFKTHSFRVYEETKYDSTRKKDVSLGFAYNQNSNLKFDYDTSKLAQLMTAISKFKDSPRTEIRFELKNPDGAKSQCIDLAYKNAKSKAQAIAKSAGKKLKECVKISYEPFEASVQSKSDFGGLSKTGINGLQLDSAIENVLVPEDIEISEELYCLFIAE